MPPCASRPTSRAAAATSDDHSRARAGVPARDGTELTGTVQTSARSDPGAFFVCARHGAQRRDWRYSPSCGGEGMTWGCKSPTGPARGTVSRTARVPIVRWDLKEAEGKALARRTGIAYEAAAVGEKARIFEARYLHGNGGRICGGYKCEGRAPYPGRSGHLPCATAIARSREGWPEVSRGHSSVADHGMKGRT